MPPTATVPPASGPVPYSPLREVTEAPLRPGCIEDLTKELHSYERDLEIGMGYEVYEMAFDSFSSTVKIATYLDKKLKQWKLKYAKAKVRYEQNTQQVNASLTAAQQQAATATTEKAEIMATNDNLRNEIETLRQTIKWYLSSNEELRSTNDDLRRENEDLRAALWIENTDSESDC